MIATDMPDLKGCIIHNRWSHQDTHFVVVFGLMASYIAFLQPGKLECNQKVVSSLQCSTLPNDEVM
jgi:hypothetical protein